MNNMNNNDIIFDQKRDGLSAFFSKIYALMGVGVLVSALVSWVMISFFLDNLLSIMKGNGFIFLLLFLVPLIFMVPLQAAASKNSPMAFPLFIGFSAFWGFLLSFILLGYTATDITLAFVTSASMFFGLSIYGRVTKRNLSGMGKAMMAAIWGIIIVGIINMFIGSTMLQLGISVVTVVVFAGLIAYDNQRIEQVYNQMDGNVSDGWAVSMALALYLDFLNLFLAVLRIFGIAGGSRD